MRPPLLLVFSKPARPGWVKTRLVGDLTAAEAARLHAAFLGDLVHRLTGGPFELAVAWAPAEEKAGQAGEPPALPLDLPPGLPAHRQRGDGLGERLYRALADGAAAGHRAVAAVGSDHPTLTRQRVEEAFALLDSGEAEAVFGPAADGGYYLVALTAAAVRRRLFEDVPWSTGGVLAATLERCRELGLVHRLLPEGRDVDTPDDLRRLAEALAEGPPGQVPDCPRTRRVLEELGRGGRS